VSLLPLSLACALYLWLAASRALAGDPAGVLIWTCYAGANLGFIISYTRTP
jgi:hypothetical protein